MIEFEKAELWQSFQALVETTVSVHDADTLSTFNTELKCFLCDTFSQGLAQDGRRSDSTQSAASVDTEPLLTGQFNV